MLSDKILHALGAFYHLPKTEVNVQTIRNAYLHHPISHLNLDNLLDMLEHPEKISHKELHFALDAIIFDLQYLEKTTKNLDPELHSFLTIMKSEIYN